MKFFKRFLLLVVSLISFLEIYGIKESAKFEQNCSIITKEQSQIFVEPNINRAPLLEAISKAKETIYILTYKLSDDKIIDSLVEAASRNVNIFILIEPEIYGHDKSANANSPIEKLKQIAKVCIRPVSDIGMEFNIEQFHGKVFIFDKKFALVSTGNIDAESFDGVKDKNIPPARDFIISVNNKAMVYQLCNVFERDYNKICELNGQSNSLLDSKKCKEDIKSENQYIVVGPDHQREAFLNLINSARSSIDFYQQSCQDKEVIEALLKAAKERNVKIRCIMPCYPFKYGENPSEQGQTKIKEVGGQVKLIDNDLYIHAKVMIIDNKDMYIGSCNFYEKSINKCREIGVVTSDQNQIQTVKKVFEADFNSGLK